MKPEVNEMALTKVNIPDFYVSPPAAFGTQYQFLNKHREAQRIREKLQRESFERLVSLFWEESVLVAVVPMGLSQKTGDFSPKWAHTTGLAGTAPDAQAAARTTQTKHKGTSHSTWGSFKVFSVLGQLLFCVIDLACRMDIVIFNQEIKFTQNTFA